MIKCECCKKEITKKNFWSHQHDDMKVYVLKRCTLYDGDVILGVFSSNENLKKHTETFGVVPVWNDDDTSDWIQNRYDDYYYSCDEFHLDDAYKD